PTLTPQQSGTRNRLQAVSPVNSRVVWASGVGGTYVVTTDGGATWRAGVVAGAEQLQFRDVQGVSARVAYLLSAGVGPASRIYKTEDGGASWSQQFQSLDPDAFYDCFAFSTARGGIAMSEAVSGRFPGLQTTDGTAWPDTAAGLPAAPTASGDTVARSSDGGTTWQLTNRPPVPGAIYGLSYVRERSAEGDADGEASATRAVVVTGPRGAAWSPDEGDTWVSLTGLANYWAVAFASPHAGWLVGTQ